MTGEAKCVYAWSSGNSQNNICKMLVVCFGCAGCLNIQPRLARMEALGVLKLIFDRLCTSKPTAKKGHTAAIILQLSLICCRRGNEIIVTGCHQSPINQSKLMFNFVCNIGFIFWLL